MTAHLLRALCMSSLLAAASLTLLGCSKEAPDTNFKRVFRVDVDKSSNRGFVWVPHQNGKKMPDGRYDGGYDTSFNAALSVCRARHEGGVHPGKLFGGKCNIGFGGKEVVFDEYDVLVARQDAFWHIGSKQKLDLSSGLVAGREADGRPLYGCVARHSSGWAIFQQYQGYHPGKLVAGQCNFGWGGKETSSSEFLVWGLGAPLAPAETAGGGSNACSGGETSCACRGFSGCSKPGYCLCLANDGKDGPEPANSAAPAAPASNDAAAD